MVMKKRFIEWFFAFIIAFQTNHKISEQSKEDKWGVKYKNWATKIDAEKNVDFEKLANDVYAFELQRKDTIESKASALFDAIGFAVALVSIPSAILINGLGCVQFIFLVLSLFNLVVGGICSLLVTKIGQFHMITVDGIMEEIKNKENLGKSEKENLVTINKIVSTEMNFPLLLKKTNLLSAAQQHFLLGIVFVSLFIIISV